MHAADSVGRPHDEFAQRTNGPDINATSNGQRVAIGVDVGPGTEFECVGHGVVTERDQIAGRSGQIANPGNVVFVRNARGHRIPIDRIVPAIVQTATVPVDKLRGDGTNIDAAGDEQNETNLAENMAASPFERMN